LYPSDEKFINAFEYQKMPSRRSQRIIRFLLSEIESYLGNEVNHANIQLEHICPYQPEQGWSEYFGENFGDIQDRLGNMVLLDTDHLGRSDFETKKETYKKTNYKLANKVAE